MPDQVAIESKHTPGPWKFQDGMIMPEDEEPNQGFADTTIFGDTVEQNQANGVLMAAAPDLLDALLDFEIVTCDDCDGSGLEHNTKNDACRGCGGCGENYIGGWPPAIKAAIAKATGKESA